MAVHPAGLLRREFLDRTETLAFQRFQQQQQFDAKEKREREDKAKKDADEIADFVLAVISDSEANEFRVALDGYDTATVEALQINRVKFDEARLKVDLLLSTAHVLPDGRRVFKTEDGLHVFDETGREVAGEQLDPHEIPDERPRWEVYEREWNGFNALKREREELLGYQEKLDDARERLNAGDMTRKEFDTLRETLKADMPEAVRAHLPDSGEPQAKAETVATKADSELDIDDDMVPSSVRPSAAAPGMGH